MARTMRFSESITCTVPGSRIPEVSTSGYRLLYFLQAARVRRTVRGVLPSSTKYSSRGIPNSATNSSPGRWQ
eukprot:3925745-Rhodomonas_salina.1